MDPSILSHCPNTSGNSETPQLSSLKSSISAESLQSNASCLANSMILTASGQSASTTKSTEPPTTPPDMNTDLPPDTRTMLLEPNLAGRQEELWLDSEDPMTSISKWSHGIPKGPIEVDDDWIRIGRDQDEGGSSFSRPPTPLLDEEPDDGPDNAFPPPPPIPEKLGKLIDRLHRQGLKDLMQRYALCHSAQDTAEVLLDIAENQMRLHSTRFQNEEPIATGETIIRWADEHWDENDPRREYVQNVQAVMIQERNAHRTKLLFDWVREGIQSRESDC
ncbi:hypothetical protein FA15DRAFT_707243 [Coprinopsis marcescibilis]|uniref:Uncharacterized protein n=1 Tax=Coprinopsis marcescibilis TaxID=230819 RepID=A0A5C3KM61_COPMA|nr:hypothetical protein FA15DRAFT_707243 [Coprinopsis marcescibilis]